MVRWLYAQTNTHTASWHLEHTDSSAILPQRHHVAYLGGCGLLVVVLFAQHSHGLIGSQHGEYTRAVELAGDDVLVVFPEDAIQLEASLLRQVPRRLVH